MTEIIHERLLTSATEQTRRKRLMCEVMEKERNLLNVIQELNHALKRRKEAKADKVINQCLSNVNHK